MSTWAKVALAIILGGAVGKVFGGAAQLKLISFVYNTEHISRTDMLSGEICLLLSAVTAVAFVLRQSKMLYVAGQLCLFGSGISLTWLSIDRDSQLYRWCNVFNSSRNQQSFQYWNSSRDPYREFLADALIFNGIPLLWAVALFWWGLKLLRQERKSLGTTVGSTA